MSRLTKTLLVIVLGGALLVGILAIALVDTAFNIDEWRGIRKGMSSSAVITALANNDVEAVVPEVAEYLTVRKENLQDIPALMGAPGICLGDNHGIGLKVVIGGDGAVTKLYESVKRIPELTDVRSGREFEGRLKEALTHHQNLEAANCLPNARWVAMAGVGQDDIAYLSRYSVWHYHVPNSYSTVALKFRKGILENIEYSWRPFEMP